MKSQEKRKIKNSKNNLPSFNPNKIETHYHSQKKVNSPKNSKKSKKKNKVTFNEEKYTVVLKNESSYLVLKTFLREYQVKNPSAFILYLSEIWRELSIYSPNSNKGIMPFALSRFLPLPGLINKRLFNVLDSDKDGYLSPKEFIQGLSIIYCEEICSLIEFIFLFYDFDYDGYITREDIHAIMSYIPVIHSFSDMIDIEEEIQNTLDNIFTEKKSKINMCEFTDLIINKEVYEIFIPLISFFYEKKPFSFKQINYFSKICSIPYGKNKNIYKINNNIKLKITKLNGEEKENSNHKIIFDFDKSKFKESTIFDNDITIFSKKETETISITNNNKNDDSEKISKRSEKDIFRNKIKNSMRIPKSNHKISFICNINTFNNTKPIRRYFKSNSIKHDENKIKINLINKFNLNKEDSEEDSNKFEDKDNKNNSNKLNNNNNDDKNNKITQKNRNKSVQTTKDLVGLSNGFRRLSQAIPSIINNTKILAKYSSSNNNKNNEIKEGLNFFRKESVIKNLYQSKIINEKDDSHITEDSFELEKIESEEYTGLKLVEENSENNKLRRTDTQGKDITYSSYLYKISTDRKIVKKLYFRLFNKDFYYFKSSTSKTYKGMHNLSHYFLELDPEFIENLKPLEKRNTESNSESYEEDESYIDSASSVTLNDKSKFNSENEKTEEENPIIKTINSVEYFCFILINQKGKIQWYLTPDKDIYDEWVDKLKQIMNYQNILHKYTLKEIVGNGKFSTVYRAIDRINGKVVAIKTIDKRILKFEELDLLKTEIDILKICQHPYVITLYEVIETYNRIDIVLEYCKISNLYEYLYNKHFELTELEIATYIHKISKAVYSMHNLGIIHRDLKLSNIALTSEKEDIRILDFGLSKILGPGETCSEGYGTPGYAAPEVIQEENYGFKIDIWSIGAITYYMCTSNLPFDYITKGLKTKNIIMNTLHDEIKFKEDCWKKYSEEVVQFIKGCMNKKPDKRLTIKEVLEHEWIKKFFYKEVTRRKSLIKTNNNYMIMDKNMVDMDKIDALKSSKRNSSSSGVYRLYVDI